jgi:hypothetical protein
MKRFKQLVRETAVEPDMPSQAAMTYKEKPNKEPMAKLKEEMSNDDKSSVALKALVAKKNMKQSEGKYKSPAFLKKMQDRIKAGDKLKEETEQLDEISAETKSSYTQKATKEVEQLKPHAQKGEYKDIAKNLIARRQKGLAMAKEEKEQGASKKKEEKFHMKLDDLVHKTFGHSPKEKMKEEKDTPPFEGGTKKPQQKAIAGKYGSGYSTARHLARQAMKKQVEKMKPVKESLEESRKSEIVKEIIKKKKNDKENTDTFQKEPVLSSEIVKA